MQGMLAHKVNKGKAYLPCRPLCSSLVVLDLEIEGQLVD